MIEQSVAPESSGRPVAFRLGLYEAIRRMAEAQRDAVATDDLDHFYDLLQDRERLLEKTEAVKQELDQRDRARADGLVRDILRIDQETESLLTRKIDSARRELDGVAIGRQALSAYGYVNASLSGTSRRA